MSRADAERMAKEADIQVDNILQLEPLEYYFKSPGVGKHSKGLLKI